MTYSLRHGVTNKIQNLKTKFINFSMASMFALTSLSGAAPLLISGTVHADADPNCSQVCINEVMSAPSSGSEWVELYNPAHVNLANWSVTDDDGHSSSFGATTLTDTYAVLDVNMLNNDGDVISLNRADSTQVGSAFTIPDATSPTDRHDQSYGRNPDGGTTLQWFTSPTKGSSNAPATTVDISTVPELRAAIENQANGQTWNITSGNYGLTPFDDISIEGQTGWYFPITVNNLTINGVGNPTLYGTGFTANGAHHTQNFLTIFGNNVTINGLTLMPKVEPNKTIEVLGNDFTLQNATIEPNTLTGQSEYNSIANAQDSSDERSWGGSVYFNNAGGTETLDNVTIKNGGISDHAPGATLDLTGVELSYETNVDWINAYRFASHGYSVNGTPQITYHVSSALNNLDSVLANVQDGDIIALDTDLTTSQQITLNKAITLNGGGHTINANFTKNGTDDNSILSIQSDNVTVNDITVDGDGIQASGLHGINVYQATGVIMNDVTAAHNVSFGVYGLVVNASKVTVHDIRTVGNFGGIDVDKGSATHPAVLTVTGTSHHSDGPLNGIYIDNPGTNNSVVDTENQYTAAPFIFGELYTIKPTDTTAPSVPTLQSPVNRGYEKTNDFNFNWSDSTDDSAVTYEFQSSQNSHTTNGALDSRVWNSLANGQTLTTSQIHSTGASDGDWYWQVRAIDAAGNKSAWTPVWKMTIDTKPPTTTINLNNEQSGYVNSRQHGDELTLTGSATDNLSLNRVYVQLIEKATGQRYGGQTVNLVPDGQNGDWQAIINTKQLTMPNGVYYAVATVTDMAGNSTTTPFLTFTLDNQKPVASFTSATNSPTNNSYNADFTVGYDVSDNYQLNNVGVALFDTDASHSNHWAAGCYAKSNETSANDQGTCTIHIGNLPDGKYYVAVQGQDAAGLWTVAATRTIYIDTTGPAVTLDSPATGATINSLKGLTVNGTVDDSDVSGVDRVVVYVKDLTAGTQSKTTQASVTGGTWTINLDPGLLPDGHQLRIIAYAKDGLKNTGVTTHVDITVDNTAPVATISAYSGTDTTPTLTGTIDDPAADLLIAIDGSSTTAATNNGDGTWSFDIASALSVGTHTITLTATDKTGNNYQVTADVSVENPHASQTGMDASQGSGKSDQAPGHQPTVTITPNNDGHVLGASIDKSGDDSAVKDAKVKGDSIDLTSKQSTDHSAKTASTMFMGLGWWWLAVVAALVIFFGLIFRKSGSNQA